MANNGSGAFLSERVTNRRQAARSSQERARESDATVREPAAAASEVVRHV